MIQPSATKAVSGAKDRTEQERLPHDPDALSARRFLDPHDAGIAAVAAELEPELDLGRYS
jgi:hypothetical protein